MSLHYWKYRNAKTMIDRILNLALIVSVIFLACQFGRWANNGLKIEGKEKCVPSMNGLEERCFRVGLK